MKLALWRFESSTTPSIDFLRWRKLAMAWSIIVLLIALGSLLFRGHEPGSWTSPAAR
jgi:preprotein translocase subunit SecF